jgi:hypothetical protein
VVANGVKNEEEDEEEEARAHIRDMSNSSQGLIRRGYRV